MDNKITNIPNSDNNNTKVIGDYTGNHYNSNNNMYYEKFGDKPRLLSALLVAVSIVLSMFMLYGWVQQVFFGTNFGNNPVSNSALTVLVFVVIAFLIGFTCLYFKAAIEIIINSDEIKYRYIPLIFKYKVKQHSEIEYAYVRKYSPIKEFGGWGLRYTFSYGSAITLRGDKGMQLVLKNGKKILVGTNKPDELNEALIRYGYKSPNL